VLYKVYTHLFINFYCQTFGGVLLTRNCLICINVLFTLSPPRCKVAAIFLSYIIIKIVWNIWPLRYISNYFENIALCRFHADIWILQLHSSNTPLMLIVLIWKLFLWPNPDPVSSVFTDIVVILLSFSRHGWSGQCYPTWPFISNFL
jgi:hypothetical protein